MLLSEYDNADLLIMIMLIDWYWLCWWLIMIMLLIDYDNADDTIDIDYVDDIMLAAESRDQWQIVNYPDTAAAEITKRTMLPPPPPLPHPLQPAPPTHAAGIILLFLYSFTPNLYHDLQQYSWWLEHSPPLRALEILFKIILIF